MSDLLFAGNGARLLERADWTEAYVVAEPDKQPGTPKVLVRRAGGMMTSLRGEEIVYFDGNPTISLFTGAGGMDIGLEQAGFVSVCQHEWNHDACLTLMHNRPNFFRHSALIQGDLRETPTSMILKEAGLYLGEAHLLVGGPPCQGFSTANSKSASGTYDRRNDLVYEFLRVVCEAQPKFFTMENVPGFQSFNGGEYFEAYLEAAYRCGYELVYGLCDACDYGVPQHRCRFICMGTRWDIHKIDGILASLPAPRNFDAETCRAIDLVRDMDNAVAREAYRRLTRPPGVRYFHDRPILTTPPPNHNGKRSRRFEQFYADLERDEPDRLVYSPNS